MVTAKYSAVPANAKEFVGRTMYAHASIVASRAGHGTLLSTADLSSKNPASPVNRTPQVSDHNPRDVVLNTWVPKALANITTRDHGIGSSNRAVKKTTPATAAMRIHDRLAT